MHVGRRAEALVAPGRRALHRRLTARSADLGRRLDVFLVTAIAAVLGNRLFLVVTGYPQLGNGTLHISHAIWGAFMMAGAIVAAVSYLAPSARGFVAFLGGAGFGWFIDELGKFITREVNYFFQPTFALIYITFISMYLGFRAIERRNYTATEGVANALEAVKAAALGQLDEPARREALELLDRTAAEDPLAVRVRALLMDLPALEGSAPGWWDRWTAAVRRRYLAFSGNPRFAVAADCLFGFLAAANVANAVLFALDGPGIVTFTEWVTVVSSVISSTMTVVGACWLPFSRVRAYRWLDRGQLFAIFVTQVFVFAEEQLSGTIGLVVTLALWGLLRSAMRAERDQGVMERPEPRPVVVPG